MKRNIVRFPSKHMYPYLSLVERKVAEFYHDIDRRRWLVWVQITYFHSLFRTIHGVLGNFSIMFLLVTFMTIYNATETAAWDKKMRLRLRLCAYDQPQVSYNVVIGPSLLDFNLAGSTLHILTKPWTLDWLRFPRFPRWPPDPRGAHRLHADRVVLLAHGGAASRIRFFAQSIISTASALVVIAV